MTEARRRWLLWGGLALALSPVVLNLVDNLRYRPEDRYTLLPILLIAMLLRNESGLNSKERPGLGLGCYSSH